MSESNVVPFETALEGVIKQYTMGAINVTELFGWLAANIPEMVVWHAVMASGTLTFFTEEECDEFIGDPIGANIIKLKSYVPYELQAELKSLGEVIESASKR